MANLPIVKIGHAVLREKCKDIPAGVWGQSPRGLTPELQKLIKDMVETMHKNEGVGLAANQIGKNIRLIVLECKSSKRYPSTDDFPLEVFINPKITHYSKEKVKGWEGCLSIPGYRGVTPRAKSVTFEAFTPDGKKIEKTVHDFHACVIQHEIDHIDGFFYMDRMEDLNHWMHLETFNEMIEKHIKEK